MMADAFLFHDVSRWEGKVSSGCRPYLSAWPRWTRLHQNTALMCTAIHRLYDYGLIALSDDYRILTKDSFSDDYRRALNHDGRATLPHDRRLWPSIEMVRAHLREISGACS